MNKIFKATKKIKVLSLFAFVLLTLSMIAPVTANAQPNSFKPKKIVSYDYTTALQKCTLAVPVCCADCIDKIAQQSWTISEGSSYCKDVEKFTKDGVNFLTFTPSLNAIGEESIVIDFVCQCKAGDCHCTKYQWIFDILAPSISLNATSAELLVDETKQLKATITSFDGEAIVQDLVWTSSNESVATVDANGKVTAISAGKAKITCSIAGNTSIYATCNVTVLQPVTSILLNKTKLSLVEGGEFNLVATVKPTDASDKTVTWSSSDKNVATVDANGKVTAISFGKAIITCTANDGSSVSAECKVIASPPEFSFEIDKNFLLFSFKNDSILTISSELKAYITELAADYGITAKSINFNNSELSSVFTFNSTGKLTGVKSGTIRIVANITDTDGDVFTGVANVTIK